jgi:hypothetical protein
VLAQSIAVVFSGTPASTLWRKGTATWLGSMSINPRVDRIFMQMPLNNTSDANNGGWMAAGRVDFYPWGEMPFSPKPLAAENAYNRGDFAHTRTGDSC